LKLRAPGLSAILLERLGASTTYIPHEEVYMALKLGTIDGSCTAQFMFGDAKYYESSKYYMVPAIGAPGGCTLYMNLDIWNEVPADLQALLTLGSKHMFYHQTRAMQQVPELMESDFDSWGVTKVALSDAFLAEAAKISMEMLDEVAQENERCAKMVKIIKDYNRMKGYIQ